MEIQYLWTSKFRFSTFLYILCRYALLANVLYLLDIAGKLTEKYVYVSLYLFNSKLMNYPITSCNTWYQFIGALSVLGRAAVIGTYILYSVHVFNIFLYLIRRMSTVVFAGRTWAVWGQNRIVLVYMSILGAACVALDIVRILKLSVIMIDYYHPF